MKDWLANLRPPKYLRYFFYIAYCWYRGYKSDEADAPMMAILFLWFIHNLMFLALILSYSEYSDSKGTEYVFLTAFATGVVFYFLFWFRNKWSFFVKEFKNIQPKDKIKGNIYLFIYLFFCLTIGFHMIIIDELF